MFEITATAHQDCYDCQLLQPTAEAYARATGARTMTYTSSAPWGEHWITVTR